MNREEKLHVQLFFLIWLVICVDVDTPGVQHFTLVNSYIYMLLLFTSQATKCVANNQDELRDEPFGYTSWHSRIFHISNISRMLVVCVRYHPEYLKLLHWQNATRCQCGGSFKLTQLFRPSTPPQLLKYKHRAIRPKMNVNITRCASSTVLNGKS